MGKTNDMLPDKSDILSRNRQGDPVGLKFRRPDIAQIVTQIVRTKFNEDWTDQPSITGRWKRAAWACDRTRTVRQTAAELYHPCALPYLSSIQHVADRETDQGANYYCASRSGLETMPRPCPSAPFVAFCGHVDGEHHPEIVSGFATLCYLVEIGVGRFAFAPIGWLRVDVIDDLEHVVRRDERIAVDIKCIRVEGIAESYLPASPTKSVEVINDEQGIVG